MPQVWCRLSTPRATTVGRSSTTWRRAITAGYPTLGRPFAPPPGVVPGGEALGFRGGGRAGGFPRRGSLVHRLGGGVRAQGAATRERVDGGLRPPVRAAGGGRFGGADGGGCVRVRRGVAGR